MHFILLVFIAASCILEPGLSLINDSSRGASGGGSRDGGGSYHTAHGGSSSCAQGRTSLPRRKTNRLAPSATSTTMTAFSMAVIGGSTATVLPRRYCSYPADTRFHHPLAHDPGCCTGGILSSGDNNSRNIRNRSSLISIRSPWMLLLSTSTLGRASIGRLSSSRLAARGFVDSHSDGDDDFPFRNDGSRLVDSNTQSKALPSQQRGRTRPRHPSMQTGAPPNSDDARIPRLRQRGGGGVAGRGTAAASAAAAAASATGTARAKTGEGIDQNNPLVKAWNSAKVLNPSRDEFPLGGVQQQQKQRQGRRRREGFEEGEEVGIRGRTRAGVREDGRQSASGRGGGRGRGKGRKAMPVGVYKGDDRVPWYIKEVQEKGLDKEGSFEQWWKNNLEPQAVMASIKHMKVEELKAQLRKMELPTKGLKKAELAERLAEGLRKFSLSDDNFQHAEVVDTTSEDSGLPNCFPQVYETLSESELEQLWRDSVRRKP